MISYMYSLNPWARKTIGAVYLIVIALLSLWPAKSIPHISLFLGADKLVHICMYLGLSFLACWIYDIGHQRIWFIYSLLAAVFMYGALMEILQLTMHNGRSFDFKDMIANLVGAITGALIYRYLDRMHLEKSGCLSAE
ncbi:MAG: VanZ family protein [Desulfuromonadaceae bacterium]